MNLVRGFVLFSSLFAVALLVGSRPTAGASDAELLAKVWAEADRLEKEPASELFGTLTSEEGKASFRLTKEQVDFSGRLDELTRAILKAMLLRGLDGKTPLPSAVLSERLGEAGKQLRQVLVSHAEAIVFDVVFSSDKASRLRKKFGRRPTPAPASRYGPYRMTGCMPVQKLDQLKSELEQEQRILNHAQSSYLFASFIGRARTPTGISTEQLQLANRLDQLSRDLLLGWLSRNLIAGRVPETDWEAADWFEAWNGLHKSLVARAEAILLQGILSAPQAETCLLAYWKDMGPLSLWDPELAYRLKLSKDQRSLLPEQFAKRVNLEYQEAGLMALIGSKEKDEFGRDVGELARAYKRSLREEADWAVLSVLTPSQLKRLDQILGTQSRPPQTPGGQPPPAPIGRKRHTRKV
jgi:hypothetical protein